ncbi:hypothetical protein MLD38_014642 [Melastoma candidum]|uniref:Uncharacterized protein n=1 Tax=Melastoma candidum TaxID=119954 RepID=A0ACB9RGJ2_9MYRT|nr:hypothetical protein MLD38_014642 [Melastoma candidum]
MNAMGRTVVQHCEDNAPEPKNWEDCNSLSEINKGLVPLEDLGNTRQSHEILEKGHMLYGCSHYRRRCCIRATCCNEVFDCRHCHNEAKNSIGVHQNQRHEISRHQIQAVICSLCGTEQEVHQVCINCGVCMGKYFCATCRLFDDDISKKQYHCDGCGICRIGGSENFFHCHKCRCCYSNLLRNSHPCVEGAMHHDCPVCFEYLFESRNDVTVLPCGHTIHQSCLDEMRGHYQYACPLCLKSVCDMSKVWEKFDLEIAAMAKPYENKMVWILCNDCGKTSHVQYHGVAHKCLNCRMAEWSKAPDSSSGPRKRAWVQIPLLTFLQALFT